VKKEKERMKNQRANMVENVIGKTQPIWRHMLIQVQHVTFMVRLDRDGVLWVGRAVK
jgi:hypothetical protein